MTTEEELRDAGRYLYADPRERADWIRDQLRDSSPCFTCHAPEPPIIEGRYCSQCPDQSGFEATRAARLARENHA